MFTSLTQSLAPFQTGIMLLILVLIIILLTLMLAYIASLQKRINAIPHITLSEDITNRLSAHDLSLGEHDGQIEEIKRAITSLNAKQSYSYRSFVHRYNPFRESGVGGNQSFSIVLANEHGDGLLITSLYSREMNRVSSKPLTRWTNEEYSISPEEQYAIDQLKNK